MSEAGQGKSPDPNVRMDRLISMATQLTDEIEEMATESGHQFTSLAKTARTNRRLIWGTIIGGFLDIVLTVVLAIIGVGVTSNTHRIDTLTNQLNQDNTAARKRALCPLYGIFKDSKSAAGRAAAPDPKKYDHAYEVINQGYLVLGCDKFLKQSGKDAW